VFCPAPSALVQDDVEEARDSCGVWDHTMRKLAGSLVLGVDCSVSRAWDPTPMTPRAAYAALRGTGIAVKARCGGNVEEIIEAIDAPAYPDPSLILDIARVDEDGEAYRAAAAQHYAVAQDRLASVYGE
jgi:hypothetical protein